MEFQHIFPVVEGLQYGLTAAETKRLEDSVSAGENVYLTGLFQFLETLKAVEYSDRALQAAGMQMAPLGVRAVAYLSAPLLALLTKLERVPQRLKPTFTFLHKHIGTLCQIASLVSSVALLVFGQTYFAVTSLTVLGLGILDRKGWLPLKARQCFHFVSNPLLIATGLFSKEVLGQAISWISIAAYFIDLYLSKRKKPETKPSAPLSTLNLENLKKILANTTKLEINRAHIHYPILKVATPNIDFKILGQEFDQIDWQKHEKTLSAKLKMDPRYQAAHPRETTLKQKIAYAKQSLASLLNAVSKKEILEGEPANYEQLQDYLKIAAHYIQNEPNEFNRANILLQLAVEGGGYCGPGKFKAAENVYSELYCERSDIPIQQKILHVLQTTREITMQKLYNFCIEDKAVKKMGKLVDWHDVHNYNVFLNVYGHEFGLRKAGADNDATAVAGPISKFLGYYVAHRYFEQPFWMINNLDYAVETLIEIIGTPALPKHALYSWWQNEWISKQPERESLTEEFTDPEGPKLYGYPVEVNGKFTYAFLAATLFAMGIAKEKTSQPQAIAQTSGSNPLLQAVPAHALRC